MEGLKLIEAGGVMLLFALIVLTLTLTRVGEVDTSVLMISAFPFLVILGVILIVVGWMMKKSEAVSYRLEDVRKWAKWQIQGITMAIIGVIIFVDGLVIWTSFPVYETPVYHPEVMFALCGMMPVGIFLTMAGIASYIYYRDKVKRHGTRRAERD